MHRGPVFVRSTIHIRPGRINERPNIEYTCNGEQVPLGSFFHCSLEAAEVSRFLIGTAMTMRLG